MLVDTSEPSDSEVEDDDNEANEENLNVLADAAIAQLGLTEPYPQMQVSKKFLLSLVPLYRGGNISSFPHNWEKLTSDVNIISIIKYGLTLRTRGEPEANKPFAYGCSDSEQALLTEEIRKMVEKRIILPSDVCSSDFFSPVFLREKQDGSHRFILNLKKFNKQVDKIHFKMESIKNVIRMVTPGCWMASIDLKDAYYSVWVNPDHQRFLKFYSDGSFQYATMPNGYRDAPRIFTKVMKPPFGTLREQGHQSVIYLDDSFLQALSRSECRLNVIITVRVLISLGFTIHPIKSVLDPVQEIEFLGFMVNSVNMTLSLTSKKRRKIKILCEDVMKTKRPSIREVAKLIGNMVATEEAVPLAPLHYRRLETEKTYATRQARGDYDSPMKLSAKALIHIQWWIQNLDSVYRSLKPLPVSVTIFSDASKKGWGATMDTHHTYGQWLETEWSEGDINIMEITAAKFALLAFQKFIPMPPPRKHLFSTHIRFMVDNTTAVAYINHMGGSRSIRCNKIANEMWTWAEEKGVWLSAAHIPGKDNVQADYYSREQNDSKEWAITPKLFQNLRKILGQPDIDLFASRTNCQVRPYVSWHPDPDCFAVDAFSLPWTHNLSYCFPLFSLVGRVIQKIREDKATAILVAPLWPTQSWYPTVLSMLVGYPVVFPARRANLYLPHKPTETHPLSDNLRLMAVKVSGDCSQAIDFRRQHREWSSQHGERTPSAGMRRSLPSGKTFVVGRDVIPYTPL